MKIVPRYSRNQSGATMVEYAFASLIFVVTMLWIGFALESSAITGRDSSLQSIVASKRDGDSWRPASMSPCGIVITDPQDCY